jgi:arginine decarboxylase
MITQALLKTSWKEVNGRNGLVIGNRIPKDYFVTCGHGESDITIHAGSYHLALKSAGIEMANIMTYSSILPGISSEVRKPDSIEHGAVVESIMAACHSERGERASAGIIVGWLHDRISDEKYGGLVCEHNGNYTLDVIEDLLESSLNELYTNGFEERFYIKDKRLIMESFIPQKRYGTALAAICFTNYFYPVISTNVV